VASLLTTLTQGLLGTENQSLTEALNMSVPLQTETRTVNGSVSGRGLLQRPYAQRLSLAVEYKTGQLKLDPTLKNVCETFHVSQTDLRNALKVHEDRVYDALANGSEAPPRDSVAQVVDRWTAMSAAERERVVRAIGPAEVWDALSAVVA